MLDISVAYNRFKFLGSEFLTWLWFSIDSDTSKLPLIQSLSIGNRIVLENRQHNSVETLTIKGDEAGLEEGLLSLRKGAVVTEISLIYREGQNNKWTFSLKGESLSVQQIRHPDVGTLETKEDIDALVYEKSHHYTKIIDIIDALFSEFIMLRLSDKWSSGTVIQIKNWISQNMLIRS